MDNGVIEIVHALSTVVGYIRAAICLEVNSLNFTALVQAVTLAYAEHIRILKASRSGRREGYCPWETLFCSASCGT